MLFFLESFAGAFATWYIVQLPAFVSSPTFFSAFAFSK